ncbi:ferredoxin FdxA [Herminiimonas aquatilis]|uniref:Ferredoxin n=1 Tax=Herminiimonas aquatilis TaxID=345342 RepID=A0ABW2J8X9_9BURK
MPFVVTESCIQCKYTDCVAVCPMDCFFEGPNFLAINPDECIDCSVCVPECPVNAIIGASEIAEEQKHFVELNRTLSHHPDWKRIKLQQEPLPDHAKWAQVDDKISLLQTTVKTGNFANGK